MPANHARASRPAIAARVLGAVLLITTTIAVGQVAGTARTAEAAATPTPTTTTVTSSADPAKAGATVTYTATVSPNPGGGTVTFADRGTQIAGCFDVPVDTGRATCQVTATAGPHSMKPTYGGDDSFAASTSALLIEVAYAWTPGTRWEYSNLGYGLLGAVVEKIWDAAARLGYGSTFQAEAGGPITDDHVEFHRVGIPAVDIIDIDYPWWHTKDDTLDKIGQGSLQIVGDVMMYVVRTER